MMAKVKGVKPLDGHRLRLRFLDGAQGVVDVAASVGFTGVFARLRDRDYFRKVRVDQEAGTICWPNGADLDPDVLYWRATGKAPWKAKRR